MYDNNQYIIFLRILLFLIVFTLPFALFGQREYEHGYVITNDNDTLYGNIRDRKSATFGHIFKKVRFLDKNIFPRRYSPYQIKGYKRGGDIFESLWVNMSGGLFRSVYMSIEGTGEKWFLKVIVKGSLTYYHHEYVNPESGYFDVTSFFKKENQPEMVRVNTGIFGLNRNRLMEYLNDCPELSYKISTRDIKDPVSIAAFYNEWKESISPVIPDI